MVCYQLDSLWKMLLNEDQRIFETKVTSVTEMCFFDLFSDFERFKLNQTYVISIGAELQSSMFCKVILEVIKRLKSNKIQSLLRIYPFSALLLSIYHLNST